MAKLTPEACRAARGLLRWGVRELAAEAGVSPTTITQFEAGRPHVSTTAEAIVTAFEKRGVEITNSEGTGARLLKSAPRKKARKK